MKMFRNETITLFYTFINHPLRKACLRQDLWSYLDLGTVLSIHSSMRRFPDPLTSRVDVVA